MQILPGSEGMYWKSIGSLTSRSEGRRSCILTLMGLERLVSRYGGVRNTMATCLWTSAWEKLPFPSQESWKKRTSMSSAEEHKTGNAKKMQKLRIDNLWSTSDVKLKVKGFDVSSTNVTTLLAVEMATRHPPGELRPKSYTISSKIQGSQAFFTLMECVSWLKLSHGGLHGECPTTPTSGIQSTRCTAHSPAIRTLLQTTEGKWLHVIQKC